MSLSLFLAGLLIAVVPGGHHEFRKGVVQLGSPHRTHAWLSSVAEELSDDLRKIVIDGPRESERRLRASIISCTGDECPIGGLVWVLSRDDFTINVPDDLPLNDILRCDERKTSREWEIKGHVFLSMLCETYGLTMTYHWRGVILTRGPRQAPR